MSVFDLDSIDWSEPRIVQTKRGPRRARTWKIPEQSSFWHLWREGYLKQLGYQVSKWNEEWTLTEWREPDGADLDGTSEAIAAAEAQERDMATAANVDPVLPRAMQERFNEVERIYDEIEQETGEDYRYQLPSIKRLALAIAAHSGALDASDTGVGKTPVACAVGKVLGRDLFVVCPKTVIAPWHRMAALFDMDATIINYELLRTGNLAYASAEEKKWLDPKSGRVRRKRSFHFNEKVVDPEKTLVVFDDCHKMKDYKTWNCLMGVQALGQRYKVLGASATAADNPMQMKFVSLLTGLIWHPSEFFGWMLSNGVKRGRWGLQFVGGREVLARIHRQIFPARGSRIRIADLGDRFPQTKIIADAFNMETVEEETGMRIQDIYDEMHREIAKLEAREAQDRGANILTEILRARQRIELLKVPTMVEMAKDALEEGMSVVLIFNFDDSVTGAAKRLAAPGLTPHTITGKTKPRDRQDTIDAFNADDEEVSVVILNIMVGGVGVSLQGHSGGRHRMVLISPSYSGIDLKQALGRVHRAGGARSIQKVVFAAGTIEEKACAKVRRKIQRIDILNEGEITTALQGL